MATTSPNVLVLLLQGGDPDEAQRALARRGVEGEHVKVVAPASVGALQWLTSDEDQARRDAAHRAVDAEQALDGPVDAEQGDTDPVLAVEDALRTFEADEILLVGGQDDPALELGLRHLGRPVTRLGASAPPAPADAVRGGAARVTQGRSETTPFAFVGPVAVVVAAVVAVIIALAVLAIWVF